LFLSTIGATPGKLLFRTRVTSASGGRIGVLRALVRGGRVWWLGLAAAFWFVPLLAMSLSDTLWLWSVGGCVLIAPFLALLTARFQLRRDGVTRWDREGGTRVTHRKVGELRVVAGFVLLLAFWWICATSGAALKRITHVGEGRLDRGQGMSAFVSA
jgi:hypothetical protein